MTTETNSLKLEYVAWVIAKFDGLPCPTYEEYLEQRINDFEAKKEKLLSNLKNVDEKIYNQLAPSSYIHCNTKLDDESFFKLIRLMLI